MRHSIELKKETIQIKATVALMVHGGAVELSGNGIIGAYKNAAMRPFSRHLSGAGSGLGQSSPSRGLTVNPVIGASRSRLRKNSLRESKLSVSEARLSFSVFCVSPEFSAVTPCADALRAEASKQLSQNSMCGWPEGNRTSGILTQRRPLRGLTVHDPKNVAVRLSATCGPETNCCGAADSYQNKK